MISGMISPSDQVLLTKYSSTIILFLNEWLLLTYDSVSLAIVCGFYLCCCVRWVYFCLIMMSGPG